MVHECCSDPYETFKMQVLAALMLEGPNSLFYKNLIQTGKAPAFCPGYGFDYTTRQGTFTVGVQGISGKDAPVLLAEINSILAKAAEEGFEKHLFETVLHQLEFAAKRTKSHRGLGYLSHMVPYCLHGGEPTSVFKLDEFASRLRQEFDDGVFEKMIRRHLIDNKHQLRLTSLPSEEHANKEQMAEQKQLSMLQEVLTEQEKQSIVSETYALR